jgi:hypothetical protein
MSDEREYVIGREMAAALEAEERRREAQGEVPSPLPPGGDRPWLDQVGLLRITMLPYDVALAAFAREYRESPLDRRAEIRDDVALDDAYMLMAYARRAAVFALRSRAIEYVIDGLSACAAIGPERIDQRDVLRVLACLHHAALQCGADPAASLEQAAAIGDSAFERLALSFLGRPSTKTDLRDAWGLIEVDGPDGVGLLEWGFAPWVPTLDVVGTSLRMSSELRGGDYAIDDPSLAVKLPAVWLSEAGDPMLGPILDAARGAALIHGRLSSHVSPDYASQQLLIWLVELHDDRAAERLVGLSQVPYPGHALLGLARGPLFVLVVAGSFVQGVAAFEDHDSVMRFEPAIRVALVG